MDRMADVTQTAPFKDFLPVRHKEDYVCQRLFAFKDLCGFANPVHCKLYYCFEGLIPKTAKDEKDIYTRVLRGIFFWSKF